MTMEADPPAAPALGPAPADATDRKTPHRFAAVVAVGVLILVFATLSWSAARRKSPTMDEPMHALAGWLWTHERDYRFDPEDPPLWGYWMSLLNRRGAIRVDLRDPYWQGIPQTHWTQSPWWLRTLHQIPENDPYALVRRARAMALVIGVALGATIAWYARKLAGPVAALIAACLFAFDPNFLGHAPLVKNDVAISLVFAALSYALWRAGTKLTITNALAICVLCGVAMSVKFSGVLALPIAAAVLLTRALLPAPWPRRRGTLETRGQRMKTVVLLCIMIAVVAPVVVWASYGFRYRAIPDGTSMNIQWQMAMSVKARMQAANPAHRPTAAEMSVYPRGPFVDAVLAINRLRLMPEAWNNGLLYTYHTSLVRPSYLLGEVRMTGWWYYFPLAMAVKTPLATIAITIIALVVAIRLRLGAADPSKQWALLCLLIPAGIYFLMTLRTNLNIGLRHVLPVYPLLYVTIAWAIAEAWGARVRFIRPTTIALAMLLAVETLVAWPNYIAFFNVAAGGPRGGIRLLGDSSLDWGQDLPRLAAWQREHPDRPIHLRYFGSADPGDFVPHVPLNPAQPQMPAPPAVVAVSATFLQGLYVPEGARAFFESLRRQEPLAVLGGTIYLFEPPPATSGASTSDTSDRAASTTATAPSGTSTSP